METTTTILSFNKEALFTRCNVDIANHGMSMQDPIFMCEHDRSWFDVALSDAAHVVVGELARISRSTCHPMASDCLYLYFEVEPANKRQELMLPNAIERYILSHVVNMWYLQRLNSSITDTTEPLLALKHVTLINNCVKRKPNY